jgi:hypothetical protein
MLGEVDAIELLPLRARVRVPVRRTWRYLLDRPVAPALVERSERHDLRLLSATGAASPKATRSSSLPTGSFPRKVVRALPDGGNQAQSLSLFTLPSRGGEGRESGSSELRDRRVGSP